MTGCAKNGFVMSPSRGTKGEVIWSSCSRRVVQSLNMACLEENNGHKKPEWDHYQKYRDMPGLKLSSDEQCQFLLRFVILFSGCGCASARSITMMGLIHNSILNLIIF